MSVKIHFKDSASRGRLFRARCAEKEMTLPTKADVARSSEARVRADASFKKEERAKDGAKAMTEYLDNARLVRERTERLRALRLAKKAAEEAAEKQAPPAKKAAAGKR
jgi:hypothetical protein